MRVHWKIEKQTYRGNCLKKGGWDSLQEGSWHPNAHYTIARFSSWKSLKTHLSFCMKTNGWRYFSISILIFKGNLPSPGKIFILLTFIWLLITAYKLIHKTFQFYLQSSPSSKNFLSIHHYSQSLCHTSFLGTSTCVLYPDSFKTNQLKILLLKNFTLHNWERSFSAFLRSFGKVCSNLNWLYYEIIDIGVPTGFKDWCSILVVQNMCQN